MSTSYHIKDENALYYLTFAVVSWVDVFSKNNYRDIVIESLKYCRREKGLLLYGYVIMTNHLHLIVKAKEGFKLSAIIRDFKKFTSKKCLEEIQNIPESRREWMLQIFKNAGKSNPNNEKYQFWQQDNHPIELYSGEVIKQKLNYIHNNPVRSAIVSNVEDYLYSSARNYAKLDYLIEIDEI